MMSNFIDKESDITFSMSIQKLTRHNDKDPRLLIMQGEHLYLFGGEKL